MLDDLLGFCVQKLWPKNNKITINPPIRKLINLSILDPTFEPEMLESWSKVRRTQILALFPMQTSVKYFRLAVWP